ncbi:pullulanase-type alpha-1,6-glucosidase [Cellulomonas sp. PhB150]|uniref:pullulanase-type alpha-1,6-glucosidase n=1 Tax=Cellulomonas sp. PhB150 TaxID=2485188 RepID=UPI000F48B7DE|nr:pullulanase-type alpha-1,6-glucosidase [Cellulomonas sp. PhB150]ROS31404.1 pullulanase-type alpha-1,6-glucosidase [Cellulomonas sp. PhB150]
MRRALSAGVAAALALAGVVVGQQAATAVAETYTLVGSLQSELGCAADWAPTCTDGDLAPTGDGAYVAELTLPAGSYEFKVVGDHAWDEAYGFGGSSDAGAANIPLVLAGETRLAARFDPATGRTSLTPLDLQSDAEADPQPQEPVREPGSGQQFYFVMTDRFANGETSNDDGGVTGDRLTTGFDPTDKGFYQGGDLAGLRGKLDYIKGLGTSAIWLTPSFTNKYVQGAGTDDVSAGYHGYWVTDFTTIDPHYGTMSELDGLIDDAHAKGMKVYFDIIANHTADVIQYTQTGDHPYVSEASSPYKDADGTAFSLADKVGTTFPTMNAESFPYTPVVPDAEKDVKVPAWLNDPTLYHNRGESTYAGESSTLGDFGALDDLMTENKTVVDGMADIFSDWVDVGIDGFRIDTVKHVNMEFWQSWSKQVMDHAHDVGKDDFFMFGEVYDADATKTSPYVRRTDMSSVLDFSFQSAASGYAGGGSAKSLAGLYASDDYYTMPDSSASALPTFLGNHDMGRIGYFLDGKSDVEQRDVLAHQLMFLTRGQPVVYYGDEQGFVGTGGDKDARQSMFGTQVDAYANQQLVDGTTMGTDDHFDTGSALYGDIAALGALRKANPALADGAQVEQYVADGTGVYAFSRVDRDDKVEYLVAVNNATTTKTATFSPLSPTATFEGVYGADDEVTADGDVTLTVPALSAVVYRATSELPARTDAPTPTFTGAPGEPVKALNPVAVTLDEQAYAETTFDYRVAGDDEWTTLGTSDTGAPRVFHTTAGLAAGSLVEYRATVVDASGNTSVTSTFATVGEGYGGGTPVEEDAASKVTVPGDHNSEMGCPADWQPTCADAELTLQANGLYSASFDLPAGTYQYKAAIGAAFHEAAGDENGGWFENYGVDGVKNSAADNISYTVTDPDRAVTFWYDPSTHRVTNDAAGAVYTVAGSFQTALGCTADWNQNCLTGLLADADGDGTWTYTTSAIPAGSYEAKALKGFSWDTSYGTASGGNVAFSVTAETPTVTFSLDTSSGVLSIDAAQPPTDPGGGGDLLVTVPGSHNSEMGCAADWSPDCADAVLTKQPGGVYAGTFTLPAGDYEYKVAIGGSWTENYGAGGVRDGGNAAYSLTATTDVTFVYDPVTHAFTSTVDGPIYRLTGSFQSELGCTSDWQPECLAAWLQDPDGDGTFTFSTTKLPTGSYEVKTTQGSWDPNWGADGVPGGANIAFSATEGKQVLFSFDSATHVLTVTVADPPLPGTGQQRAHWVTRSTLAWPRDLLPAGADPADLTWSLFHAPTGGLTLTDGIVSGGNGLALTYDPDGLPTAVTDEFPALTGYVALTVDGDTAADLLTGQLAVLQSGDDGASAWTGVQIPGVVDDLYAQAADDADLGISWHGGDPTFALWAPTAKDVDLLLWTDGTTGEPRRVQAERSADGVWRVAGDDAWTGAAYRYDVSVYVPSTDEVEHNVVTDPYSVALTTDSTHSVVVDLDDPSTQPALWADTKAPLVEKAVDRTIYELHVRDFSIKDETVPAAERGTYLAFARDSAGTRHLRELAAAGLNTVHLLPTFDIATIAEKKADQATPDCDLASYGPAATEQQACVAAVAGSDGFNWGYDPFHYQAPEGSYAVDPEGASRVSEFRTMVGALHATGLQVVLDEVFNHTAASGQADTSVLDKVVPGYYHRLNAVGAVETSTCCQNVATEHALAGKLMVDSVVLWAKQYKVDGFRFDLMGHHSKQNLLDVRAALDELTLAKDGVDGTKIYLYGEGWNFGEVADDALFTQATQGQLGGTGIGTFSDRLRDAVRGGGPFDENPRVQGFGSGGYTDPNGDAVNGTEAEQLTRAQHDADLVRLGLAGNLKDFTFTTSDGQVRSGSQIDYNGQPAGYADEPDEVITYVDAHDNETLWDSLTMKLPQATTMSDRIRMNTLSLATTALAQTPSFWHAGADMLRSKSLDRNSYDSGDWFNAIDWTGADNGFGHGLPPAADNEAKWPYQAPLLEDAALKPTAAQVATASDQAQDLLRLRSSSRLFRLGSAAAIEQKVTFPGSGADAAPGVIVMSIDDTVGTDADPALDGALVVLNAGTSAVTQTVPALAGRAYALSPVQADGADAVVRTTTWDAGSGAVTVPARTVAVLVEAQDDDGGPDPTPTATPTPKPTHPHPTPRPTHTKPAHPTPKPTHTTHPKPTPKPKPTHKPGKPHLSLSLGSVRAGGTVHVAGGGFTPGERVQVWLHSEPVLLVATDADASGELDVTATVPVSTPVGAHTVVVTGLSSGLSAQAPLRVLAADDPGALGATGFGPALGVVAALALLAGVVATVVARRWPGAAG